MPRPMDPEIQFHLSVEPGLVPGAPFSQQRRTVSSPGARGEAGGEGIYTTSNPGHWFSQLAYEGVGTLPRFVYLVHVREPTAAGAWAVHQDLSEPAGVTVLALLMEAPECGDEPLDVGRLVWLAERWLSDNPAPGPVPRGP